MIKYFLDKKFTKFEIKECHNVIHSTKEHFHKELQLAIIEKGRTTVNFEGNNYAFTERDLVIIPPNLTHRCVPANSADWKCTLVYVCHNWFVQTFDIKTKQNMLYYYKLDEEEWRKIKKKIEQLKRSMHPKIKELCLISLIEKFILQKHPQLDIIMLTCQKKQKIEKLKEYLEKQFTKKLSLEELSIISGLSKYHLIRSFKTIYGVSPFVYQRSIRFNFAKNELKTGKNISEIAVTLGYSDQSHFTNEFKKFSGITPYAYRKSL